MDELDRQLIAELQRDGRAHVTTLAHRLDVPRSTVQERLKRLQDSGIIRRFGPVLDWSKLGKPVQAHILARFTAQPGVPQRDVARRLAEIPGIEAVHVATGEWDLILRVRGADLEEIGELVLDRIRTVPGVERTLTCASFHVAEAPPAVPASPPA